MRYKAFISYSHVDKRWAKWLHTCLETFHTPKGLIGKIGRWGETPARLQPVFRDREELVASAELGPDIQQALGDSEFLVVLCSPAAAGSEWVNEEIRYFRSVRGVDHVLAVIVAGEPGAAVGDGQPGCFPPALLEPEPGSNTPTEPIAADARRHGDGRRFAIMKIEAGLLGVGLNDLVQRESARRQRRLAIIAGASLCGAALMLVLALYANLQRIEATHQRTLAETESATAMAALDYLVRLFEIANPATEKPTTITALSILERGRKKIDVGLSDKPQIQGKLLTTIGRVYLNLGLMDEAEDALSQALSIPGAAPSDQVASALELAYAQSSRNQLDAARATLDAAEEKLRLWGPEGTDTLEDPFGLRGRLLEVRGALAYVEDDYIRAEQLDTAAKDAYGRSSGDHAEELGRLHTNLGLSLANRSEFEAARRELQAAIDIHRTYFGERHAKTAASLHNLAFTLFSEGENQAAAENISRALDIYESVLEKNHPALGDAYLMAGRIAHALGRLDEAFEYFRSAIEVFSAAFGPDYHKVGWARVYLSLVLADEGQFEAAFDALEHAEGIYELNYPGDDIWTGDLMVHRAIVLAKSGQGDRAQAMCGRGLGLIKGRMSSEDTYVQEMYRACAELELP